MTRPTEDQVIETQAEQISDLRSTVDYQRKLISALRKDITYLQDVNFEQNRVVAKLVFDEARAARAHARSARALEDANNDCS